MRKWFVYTPLLAVLLLASLGVKAQAANKTGYNISLHGGNYMFEGNQNIDDSLAYGLSLGYNFSERLGIEGIFSYIDTDTADDNATAVNVYILRGEVLYHFRPDEKLVPFVAGGLGLMQRDPEDLDEDQDGLLSYGGGLKYFFAEDRALRFDVRHILNYNTEDMDRSNDIQHNLSYGAGLVIHFGGGRAPMKSVAPVTPQERKPAAKPVVEKVAGTSKEVKAAPVASQTMEEAVGAGAPAEETAVASVQQLDSDYDGVLDTLDKCPDTPEGVLVDYKGCPPVITTPVSLILDLQFESGSSRILPEHHPELADAAQFIQKNPGSQVVVEGHTDSVGPTSYNLKLSQQRAESVRRYLIENHGIDARNIGAQGFGETKPVADNATPEGRHSNRRVVVNVLP